MKNITLVIMAAGIGSRFGGGIKQLEPVGPNGEIIMDYSIHDALEAGCSKVVFIIRRDIEKDLKNWCQWNMYISPWMNYRQERKISGTAPNPGEPARQSSASKM